MNTTSASFSLTPPENQATVGLLQHRPRIPALVPVLQQSATSGGEFPCRIEQDLSIGKEACVENGVEVGKTNGHASRRPIREPLT